MQEKANPPNNADAYSGDLTHYCAKRYDFEAKLPYQHSAEDSLFFSAINSILLIFFFIILDTVFLTEQNIAPKIVYIFY